MNGSSSPCPCDTFVHPQTIVNPPGRSAIAYRPGDYTSFREALLRSLPGEVELVNWRPGAQGDLAVQMVEWWAYLADILTFYNERIANEDYLRTATLPESVHHLISILGYRPRPGIAATGVLAALMSGSKALTLPQGFQIQSKPGPGQQPQIFELAAATTVQQPDAIPADPAPSPLLLGVGGASVLLRGVISSIKPGDTLLLMKRGWAGNDPNYAVLTVASTSPEPDPRGNKNTRVVFDESPAHLAGANAVDYRLLKSSQTGHVWQYGNDQVIFPDHVELDSIARAIKPGDPLLFQVGTASGSRGIYFSPNGMNIAGGGQTVSMGVLDRTVWLMINWREGIITAFEDGSIYYSPDGQNPGGGGNTVRVDSGAHQQVIAMVSYQPPSASQPGVLIAFVDGTIYLSPDGANLGGGGSTTLQYSGFMVSTMIAYQTGVIVSFWDENGSIFYSPDGSNLYQSPSTALPNGTGSAPVAMVVYGDQVLTEYQSDTTAIYLSAGTDLQNQQVASFTDAVYVQLVPYGSNAVMCVVQDFDKHVTTAYSSTDGQNLGAVAGNTTQVWSGSSGVLAMIAYRNGVITAFDDGTAYYSPDGQNLAGGGSTVQAASSIADEVTLLAYQNGVYAAYPNPFAVASVTSYSEVIWFANADPGNPTQPPSGSPPPAGIPIPHTSLGLRFYIMNVSDDEKRLVQLQFNWRDVGTIIATPARTLTGTQVLLETPLPQSLLPMSGQNVLISGGDGSGVEAQATTNDPSVLNLSGLGAPPPALAAPLTVLFDLLAVSRGQTVSNEVLGGGDATVAGQEFVLQKSPLTYLQAGADYKSTLQVWVDGILWREVPDFYGQASDAAVYVTREDDQNVTHVRFGDGVYGRRLPSGVNNVIGTYRYGSGAAVPDAGALSVLLKSWPGLKGVANPVAPGGGADPDPPDKIKTYAPQSVLTFGRAISADDYEAIAAEAPGVARARTYWSWDADQERMSVKIYVGDNAGAVAAAKSALAGAGDPNRPVTVIPAIAVPVALTLTVVVDPSYVLADVQAAVTAALTDPASGLLGANAVQIGQSMWESQVYQACQSVAGVVAVHKLQFSRKFVLFAGRFRFLRFPLLRLTGTCQDVRLDPGEGGYFQLAAADFNPSWEVAPNAG